MAVFFYSILVHIFHLSIKIAGFFNPKAKRWITGRQNWANKLRLELEKKVLESHPIVWIHAASAGEFEQAKPIIEKLKKSDVKNYLIVSFFSPSGMEAAKKYPFADIICYLPPDSKDNADCFLDLVNPDIVFWIKYEYWWHFLNQIHNRGIPLFLISAIFRKRQPFFHWYGRLHCQMLGFFQVIFVQDKLSQELLKEIGFIENVVVSGDTRFDRVTEIAGGWKPVEELKGWLQGNQKVVVAGSTWPDEENIIKNIANTMPDVKWIIVPHLVDENAIKESCQRFPKALLFSSMSKERNYDSNIVIINAIGYLSRLYRYADICIVGGGLGTTGLHNTLEAAVYGKPLLFGDKYEKFAEAVGLIKIGAAMAFSNAMDCEEKMKKILDDNMARKEMGNLALQFVSENTGATEAIFNYIYKNRLLTK
jgi:3-deoxy-D-manno-octulosonic-acid transferase